MLLGGFIIIRIAYYTRYNFIFDFWLESYKRLSICNNYVRAVKNQLILCLTLLLRSGIFGPQVDFAN